MAEIHFPGGGPSPTGLPGAKGPAGSLSQPAGPSFSDMLKESLNDVNELQMEADKAVEELVVGKSKNVHETMIALSKAEIAFRMTLQVRNKMVEAYQEIIRMQV